MKKLLSSVLVLFAILVGLFLPVCAEELSPSETMATENIVPDSTAPSYLQIAKDISMLVLPAIATFWLTKRSIYHPIKLDIEGRQLNEVYYPLFRTVSNEQKPIDIKFEAVVKTLDEHYMLAYPALHELVSCAIPLSQSENEFKQKYDDICSIITAEYNRLKSRLGYPKVDGLASFRKATKLTRLIMVHKLLLQIGNCLIMTLVVFFMVSLLVTAFGFGDILIIVAVPFILMVPVMLLTAIVRYRIDRG